jgi:hypothetical protein
MIYILTGITILIFALKYKRHLPKALRMLGILYLAIAVLEALTSGFGVFSSSLFFTGMRLFDTIIHLVFGVAFIVLGTKEIRMPMDEIVEDDLGDHNILAH